MQILSHHENLSLILSIGLLIIAARMFGEFFRKFKMPLVVGELIAGIILGPSLVGHYAPQISGILYTQNPNASLALSGIINISIIMLLFVAGMELNLSLIYSPSMTFTLVQEILGSKKYPIIIIGQLLNLLI